MNPMNGFNVNWKGIFIYGWDIKETFNHAEGSQGVE